jgi:hypothetical protein
MSFNHAMDFLDREAVMSLTYSSAEFSGFHSSMVKDFILLAHDAVSLHTQFPMFKRT